MSDQVYIASTYRLTAIAFIKSAKVLHRTFQEKGEPAASRMGIPFYYLASHAAELLLKCALLKRGPTLHELKSRALRHSLKELLNALVTKGVPISQKTSDIVQMLSGQHEAHALRYTALIDDGVPTFMPQPDDVFAMLDELMMAGRIATHGL